MIYVTSDLHFNHDRAFVYGPRGFDNIEEMNEVILHNLLQLKPDDDLYILGDVMLGDNQKGLKYLLQIPCRVHIVLGNHDTDTREALYRACPNVVEVALAIKLKYSKHHFFMTHYPCMTGNLERESLKQMTLNLSGHTHDKRKFYNDLPYVYNVSVDAHDCKPVSLDEVIADMEQQVRDCISYL